MARHSLQFVPLVRLRRNAGVIPCGLVSHANSLPRVFSTGPSIIHPIVRLDTRFMLALRLISQRGGNLGLRRRRRLRRPRRNFGTAFAVDDMANVLTIDDYELAEACAIVTAFQERCFAKQC
jgi:hypothetical protein